MKYEHNDKFSYGTDDVLNLINWTTKKKKNIKEKNIACIIFKNRVMLIFCYISFIMKKMDKSDNENVLKY